MLEVEQQKQIEAIWAQLNYCESKMMPMFQVDACCFNDRHHNVRAWAPMGQPLAITKRYGPGPYIAVYAAICSVRGLTMCDYKVGRAFKSDDFRDFLLQLRAVVDDAEFAVYLDNASIHKSKLVRDAAAAHGIHLVFNLAYRPDLNGIEYFWARAKHHYRRMLLGLKGGMRMYENKKVV